MELSRAMNASCLVGQENWVGQSNRMNMSQMNHSCRPSYSPHRPELQKSMALSRWEGGSKELGVSSQRPNFNKEQLGELIKAANKAHRGYREANREISRMQDKQAFLK